MQLLPRLLLPLLLTCASTCLAATSDSAKQPSELIPDRAAVSLEILKPGPLLDTLLSPAFEDRLKALPGYEGLVSGPKLRDLRNLAQLLETSMHTNWQSILRAVLRRNAAIAFGQGNRHLLVLSGDDPILLRGLHDFALQIARSEADKRGESERVRSMEYEGLTGWTFNGKEAHTLLGSQLLAASDAAVLKAAVDLRGSGAGGRLADRAEYKAARAAVGPEAMAMLFLDLDQLRGAPWFDNLAKGKQDPLAALLLADAPDVLKNAHWLALGAYAEAAGVVLKVHSDARQPAAGGASSFAQIKQGARGLAPELEVPRQIASFNLHRDLAGFYGAKDALFPERTSGLIFFENMMGIFFSGKNLTDEVLAETEPQVRLVVARQDYDKSIGTPDPQLPAFALVFQLRHPDRFGEVVEEAWQKALGLVNFTRGQKAEPGLILDRADYKGSRITFAKFSANDVEDRSRLDQRFNFRPSLAMAKGHAILSSTDQLARDLLTAMEKSPGPGATSAPQAHTQLKLSGADLADLLKANRMSLVRGDMVKKGKTQQEAEAGIDLFTALVGWVNLATLTTGNLGNGQTAELRLGFAKP